MARVLSCIQPTGSVHLGNLLGALRNWVADQYVDDAFHGVVDLHAITIEQDPAELRANTLQLAQLLIAVGLDPNKTTIFVQSHVREHVELAWLIQCTVSFGELRRMTQFKDKSQDNEFISAALFTYPALMAADILVYDADKVPVGDDQRQHLELTRDAAIRFNSRYGETFVVPEASVPEVGARVMDLQNPTNKMSKSAASATGTINLLEDLKVTEKKIKRAVTDSDNEVRYDIKEKPGVSNLLDILGAVTSRDPVALANDYSQYGQLKVDTAEAVVEMLRPIQARYNELAADPGGTAALLANGADKARAVAEVVLGRAKENIGLLGD